jgi:hypothetical protein
MTLETLLGYFSGLRWAAPHLDLPALVGTTVLLHACHGVMCRLFARNNGYPPRLWTLLGLTLGIWAVAGLILLPRRAGARSPSAAAGSPGPVSQRIP